MHQSVRVKNSNIMLQIVKFIPFSLLHVVATCLEVVNNIFLQMPKIRS